MINNILLDCDGVLADFLSLALEKLNKELKRNVTPEKYVKGNYGFYIEKAYDIDGNKFWDILNQNNGEFWYELKPFPWAKDLYDYLCEFADVTIATSPIYDPVCYSLKIRWLSYHLDIENTDVMIGGKKHLMAKPNNLLVDDYPKNVAKFIQEGGQGVCVPSNWNTIDLSYGDVIGAIEPFFNTIEYV